MKCNSHLEISTKISELKCCIIIPTYNNEKTVERVIDGVLQFTSNIIIVNDGCTDSTFNLLQNYQQLIQIHFPKNKGKGVALKKGFEKAVSHGYEYAITIDSDGQHYPDDIPVFIAELEKDRNCLLIGERNMVQETVPKGSSFGHKFSNFWYWIETGVKLTDTQSGYRLYPLLVLHKIKFYTTRFEFEIENIVRASWNGLKVKNIPIKVLYDPNERVSHFRPIKDFARITLLNIWLVVVAILYIKPRDVYRRIKKKGLRQFFFEDVFISADSPIKKALSVTLGVFIGITPFWGFHLIIAMSLAVVFKLNKAIVFTFSNVSIPPMIPFIIFGSIKMGSWILGTNTTFNFKNLAANIKLLSSIKEYIIGSFALATIAALVIGSTSYLLIKLKEKNSEKSTL